MVGKNTAVTWELSQDIGTYLPHYFSKVYVFFDFKTPAVTFE